MRQFLWKQHAAALSVLDRWNLLSGRRMTTCMMMVKAPHLAEDILPALRCPVICFPMEVQKRFPSLCIADGR